MQNKSVLYIGHGYGAMATATWTGSEHISKHDVYCFNASSFADTLAPDARGSTLNRQRAIIRLSKLIELCVAGFSMLVFLDRLLPSSKVGQVFGVESFPNVLFEEFVGSATEIACADCKTQLQAVQELTIHHCVAVSGPTLVPLLRVPSKLSHERKVVAAYAPIGNKGGAIFLLPPWNFAPNRQHPLGQLEAWVSVVVAVQDSLKGAVDLPAWVRQLGVREEKDAADKAQIALTKIAEAQAELSWAREHAKTIQWRKHLLTETDRHFEKAAVKAFEALGAATELGPEYRTDILALSNGTLFCIEAKGYEGATRDSAISQCDKWVKEVEGAFLKDVSERDEAEKRYASILEKFGLMLPVESIEDIPVKLKGLIISNTYRKVSVAERPPRIEEHFSETQQSRMKRAEIACITGVQLLGMCEAHRGSDANVLDRLAAASGCFEEALDWRQFLFEIPDWETPVSKSDT